RARLSDEIALASGPASTGSLTITPPKLERLSGVMREALKSGAMEFRRAYLRMFVHRVVVSRREVRISGPKSALAKAASSSEPPPGPEVLSFVREWRPLRDSNPCCRRERGASMVQRRPVLPIYASENVTLQAHLVSLRPMPYMPYVCPYPERM